MANNEVIQYIGARYITKIYENSQNPSSAEWESNVNYEPLTLVTENNSTYLSRKSVPKSVGAPSENGTYWALTGAYNGQIAALQQQIDTIVDTTIPTKISEEATARSEADDTLNNKIEYEATLRTSGDSTLNTKIDNEITNRTNADATLQNNITAEATARTSADTLLQSEIDELIAPSGEAPSAAEVENARIGADGVTYASLGTAIRTQVSNLADIVNESILVKNLVNISSFDSGKRYANLGGNIGTVSADNNYGVIDKIRLLKDHTYYTIFGGTGSFVHIAGVDNTYIGNVSTIVESTATRGTITVQKLKPTVDCYLCATCNNNSPYINMFSVTEEICPYGFNAYNQPIVVMHNGKPLTDFVDTVDLTVMDFFGNFKAAFAYINSGTREDWHWIKVKLGSDTYETDEQIELADHIEIEGVSSENTIIDYIPDNPSAADVEAYSLFMVKKNAKFKNLTMRCINGRYVVHCESNNNIKDWTVNIERCKFIHYNNTLGSWNSQHAWGEGASSGSYLHAVDCEFITEAESTTETAAVLIHNNTSFDKPMLHVFDNCKFIGASNNRAITLMGLASDTDDKCIFNNCYFKGNIYDLSQQTIKAEVYGSNLVPTNASNYFTNNSVAEYEEYTKEMTNNSGLTILAGTLVAYSSNRTIKVAETGDLLAGFVNEDVANNGKCKVVCKGYYRKPDGSQMGQKYTVDNGSFVSDNDGEYGVSNGNGFVFFEGAFVS